MLLEDEGGSLGLGEMYPEPDRPKPPPATIQVYSRDALPSREALTNDMDRGPSQLTIHLVGQHPLWGHHLWNASKIFTAYLDENWIDLCRGRRVLELGAGGGLPGLVAACNGASSVVLTDYPDPDLIANLEKNVKENLSGEALSRTRVQGFVWGSNSADLTKEGLFDMLIMSDLVFNHSQHNALLKTCNEVLRQRVPTDTKSLTPCALVFFTHHRPWLAELDMSFFTNARSTGLTCEKLLEMHTGAMFKDDKGDEHVRGTVHGWRMYRA